MYQYSPSTNSFYPDDLLSVYEDAGTLPNDLVPVDEDVFREFTATPEPGKIRVAGSDGLPAWGDIPPPTHEELISIAEQVRQQLLTHADAVMLDWRTELMLGEISDANRAKLSAWLAYKNDVKAVDVATDPEHINWPVPPEV
ncbi:tail fiber assembly protein [Citrobacter sp. Cb025]|uniref:tail fiber assembly protein n=1 Tax=Citrobacter sp. Cb025 TaxID=2985021 RepID=UPI0019C29CFD|nr:tail fiber assembly protein [Citrobacter sp. Cb025]EKW6310396.1 tail fiber assembly protein [Escherichia coli]HBC6265918.1 tail fiber assembly protein [Citrobacter braakii]MDM3419072.1 tail fiber assembly protein [Citrobacter sp. Cb025]HAM5179614.1 tail fiber assembly protein [Escherichia coli]HBC8732125.1 tail fiber assembly protein [Citrobacter braakii]